MIFSHKNLGCCLIEHLYPYSKFASISFVPIVLNSWARKRRLHKEELLTRRRSPNNQLVMSFIQTRSYAALLDCWARIQMGWVHLVFSMWKKKNQHGTMKNHENRPGTIKNQPGAMKNHENRPGTMKNHKNRPGTMKNQTGTMKNH